MKLIKIRFTAWRDAAAPRADKAPSTELEAASAKLDALDARKRELLGDSDHAQTMLKMLGTEEARDKVESIAAEFDNVETARKAALAAQESAASVEMLAAKNHPRSGSFGYQVLNTEAAQVIDLVDDQGQPLPAGAVYECEIVDTKPAEPAWFAAMNVEALPADAGADIKVTG